MMMIQRLRLKESTCTCNCMAQAGSTRQNHHSLSHKHNQLDNHSPHNLPSVYEENNQKSFVNFVPSYNLLVWTNKLWIILCPRCILNIYAFFTWIFLSKGEWNLNKDTKNDCVCWSAREEDIAKGMSLFSYFIFVHWLREALKKKCNKCYCGGVPPTKCYTF